MKSIKVIPCSLLFIFSLCACGGASENDKQTALNYELTIVDSIQVDLFSSGLMISDVQSVTGNLLAIQSDPPVAYVLSPDGEVLKKMDRPKDDPQAVGRILCGEFYEDGIALMGYMVVKTYDIDFNLKKSLKAPYIVSGMIYMRANHLFEFGGENQRQLLTFFGPQTETPPMKKEYYQEFNIVDVLDPKKGVNEQNRGHYRPIGRLSADSRFLKGRAFYFLRPLFDVKNDQMTYAFENDTTLFTMNLPDGEISERQRIPFDEFIFFDGYTMGPQGLKEQGSARDRKGRINHVYRIEDLTLITYSSGLQLKEIMEFDPESADFRTRLLKADYKKYLILKDGKRVNANLRFPEKVSYTDMADDQGYIWGHQNMALLDEEPEFITFYKMRLTATD